MSSREYIIVVRNGGIGDTLFLAPVVHALRSALPGHETYLLGRYERVRLLEGPSFASRAVSFEQPGIHTLYSGEPALPPPVHDFFSNARVILWYGEDREGRLEPNLENLCSGQVVLHSPRPVGDEHATDPLLRGLDWIGVPRRESTPPLEVSGELSEELEELLSWPESAGKVVVVHPGASRPEKRIRPEVWAKVLRELAWFEQIRVVVLSGAKEDRLGVALCAEVYDLDPVLIHNRPLREVAALLKNTALYLGHDSGITHLAAMVGCPTVAVFRSTDPRVWGPRGERVRIVQVEDELDAADAILENIRFD